MGSATAQLRRHRFCDQFELPRLIAQRPQVDALAPSLGIARQELSAVLHGTDTHLPAKLVGLSPQDWSENVVEHTITLRPIPRYPRPHRRERVRKAVRFAPMFLERPCQRTTGLAETLRCGVVGGREPAVG